MFRHKILCKKNSAAILIVAALFLSFPAVAAENDPLLQKARSGDIPAQLQLGREYISGSKRRKNPVLAFYWFRKAAAAGNAYGAYNLALCYEKGWGTATSEAAAFYWYQMAGKVIAAGKMKFAEMLYRGIEPETNPHGRFPGSKAEPEKALEIMRRLAENDPEYLFTLAKYLYKNAPAHAAELRRTLKTYMEKSAEPEPEAMVLYAACLRSGIGGIPDPAKAAEMLIRAAEKKYPEAMAQLAELYQIGAGVPTDRKKALSLTKQAAALGSPRAQVNMGKAYMQGLNVETDLAKAFNCFQKAGETGYPPALRYLGDCYAFGYAVSPDKKKAVEYYRQAAAAGDDQGMYALGMAYKNGEGTNQNDLESFYWLYRAAQSGSFPGMYEAGKALIEGRGVKKDFARGVQLLKQAVTVNIQAAEYLKQLEE